MGKAITKTDETRQELTGAQLNAIAALLGGSSITDAATAAGVQRQTVHEWLRQAQFVFAPRTPSPRP
jgi:transposase-like protein